MGMLLRGDDGDSLCHDTLAADLVIIWSFSGELGQGQMVEGLHVDVGVVCNLHLASAWTGVCVLGIAISAEIGS